MSDKISEKMARKLTAAFDGYPLPPPRTGGRTTPQPIIFPYIDGQMCMHIWRSAGLIKPSKLDETREWVHKNEYAGGSEETARAYAAGVRDCASHFEAAITEIMEERN